MANSLLREFESHKPLLEAKVRIDYLFAFCDRDSNGEPKNSALTHHGVPALGVTRKLSLKDRVKGNGDAEICLDGDWWEAAAEDQQRALLDHELHHLVFMGKTDDLGRPIIGLRDHDFDFGWFKIIAERHGSASIEQFQAKVLMESSGQYFWPAITSAISDGGRMSKLEVKEVSR